MKVVTYTIKLVEKDAATFLELLHNAEEEGRFCEGFEVQDFKTEEVPDDA